MNKELFNMRKNTAIPKPSAQMAYVLQKLLSTNKVMFTVFITPY